MIHLTKGIRTARLPFLSQEVLFKYSKGSIFGYINISTFQIKFLASFQLVMRNKTYMFYLQVKLKKITVYIIIIFFFLSWYNHIYNRFQLVGLRLVFTLLYTFTKNNIASDTDIRDCFVYR